LDYKVQVSVINWQALINLRSDCSLPHLCSAPHLSSQPSGSTVPLRSRSSSQLDTHSYNLRSRGVSTRSREGLWIEGGKIFGDVCFGSLRTENS
jgi:hypothetical protein